MAPGGEVSVVAGPGDEMAVGAAGLGRIRASHADREQAVGILKTAFAQGRLAKNEFDLRVGQVLASRTYGELAALTADVPAGPTDASPPRRAAQTQARPLMSNAVKVGIWVAVAVAVPAVLSAVTRVPIPFFIFLPFYLMVAAVEMHARRLEKRSRGQLPPRPGQPGHAPEVQRPGQVSRDPASPRDRPDQARADLRSDSSRPGRPRSSERGARTPCVVRPLPDAV